MNENISLKIEALSKTINAGEQARIKISSRGLNNKNIFIFWETVLGERLFNHKMSLDQMLFSFPEDLCQRSGKVKVKACYDNRILDETSFEILPLQADHKMEAFIGPKSIGVDHNINAMMVCYAEDRFGNSIKEGSSFTFQYQSYGEAAQLYETRSKHMLAYKFFDHPKKPRKILIGANSGQANIMEQELNFFNGPPENVKFELIDYYPFADDRHLIHLRSLPVKDMYGNLVADGTMLEFIVKENEQLVGAYKAYTISGLANVFIKNPNHPTTYSISTNQSSAEAIMTLQFEETISSCPLKKENGYLIIGPVIAHLDQFVSDGTNIEVTIDEVKEVLQLENGLARLKLPDHNNIHSIAIVRIGNYEKSITINWK